MDNLNHLDKIKAYSQIVQEQIRWKKAKELVKDEIEAHLSDQRDAFLYEGLPIETATDQAILQMGNPEEIGRALDLTHRPKPQWFLLCFSALILCLNGFLYAIFPQYADKYVTVPQLPENTFLVALCLLIGAYFLDFTLLGKYPKLTAFGIFLFGLLHFFWCTPQNGFHLTVNYLGIHLIPYYLSHLFLLGFAVMVYGMKGQKFLAPLNCTILGFSYLFLLGAIPSMTAFFQFFLLAHCIYFYALWKDWFSLPKSFPIVSVSLELCLVLFTLYDYRHFLKGKILTFIAPETDGGYLGSKFMVIREMMSELSFFGTGNSTIDPSAYDVYSFHYPLAFLSHELGAVFLLSVVVLGSLFFLALFQKIKKEKSMLGSILAYTIFLIFLSDALLQLLNNLGYGLTFGISDLNMMFNPFSLYANSILAGFLLSIFRTGSVARDFFHSIQQSLLGQKIQQLSPIEISVGERSFTIRLKEKKLISIRKEKV